MLRLLLLLIFIIPSSHGASTLSDVYREALKYHPLIKAQESFYSANESRYNSVLRSLGPTVQLKGSQTYREEDNRILGFAQGRERLMFLSATQPLFKGGREYAGVSLAQKQKLAEESRLNWRKRSIYQDVLRAFFSTLIQEKEILHQENLIELTKKRAADLQRRVNIGRSRRSELLLAKAQVESAKAQFNLLMREKNKFRDELKRLTNISETEELIFDHKVNFKLGPLPDYLEKLNSHPEVQTRVWEVGAQENNIQIAFRNHLPDLDLRGNYYLHREGALRNVSWDVSVNLTMPLFESGVTTSKVKEEVFKKEQQQYLLRDTQNILETQMRQIYHSLEKDLERLETLKKAADLAQENYHENQKDYALGLVSNLEVLQSLNTYVENSKIFDRAFFEVEQNKELLLTLSGEHEFN